MRSLMRAVSSVSLGSATYALAPMGMWSRQRVTDAYVLERGKNRLEFLCLESCECSRLQGYPGDPSLLCVKDDVYCILRTKGILCMFVKKIATVVVRIRTFFNCRVVSFNAMK